MKAHDADAQLVTLTGSNVKLFSFLFCFCEFCFVISYVTEVFFCPLLQCKRRFERDCKEADRAQQYFEKMDADINVTKADVEKVLFIFTSTSLTGAARDSQSSHSHPTPTHTFYFVAALPFYNYTYTYSVL